MTSRASSGLASWRNTGSGRTRRWTMRCLRMTASSRSETLSAASRSSSARRFGLEPRGVELQVVVDDVVEHGAGAVDLVHAPVLVEHGTDAGELAPLVLLGGDVPDHLEVVVGRRRREPDGDRAAEPDGGVNTSRCSASSSRSSFITATLPTWLNPMVE